MKQAQSALFDIGATKTPSLADRFIVPPFSVLDARQGYWQERKREWIACGIKGEEGRLLAGDQGETASLKGGLTYNVSFGPYDARKGSDTEAGSSIFDPVVCELVCSWFSRVSGRILDPFAGGSVRGILAHLLDRDYTGIELSARQIAANQEQAQAITPARTPRWVHGDARDVRDLADGSYDLIFSCPPYGDLERYSDDKRDLSTLKYESFLPAYRHIIRECVSLLAPDRFACFVVGDFRDGKGFYRNFVSDTIAAFQDGGAKLYNEAILITVAGSMPLRLARQFTASRKLGKTHQNVLVFCKGDPKRATEWCGSLANEVLYQLIGDAA
jgi:hypothetical protein